MPTLESFRHWIPKEDQWPISDVWAYHDWHQAGNGDVAPFMQEVETEFGAATELEDFERKAQMLNYVDHRAIFEGLNAHLWAPNSGRLLWMTQPAWPSTMWQILVQTTTPSFLLRRKESVRADPHSDGYFQLRSGCNQHDCRGGPTASLDASVYSLENKLLFENTQKLQVAANALTSASSVACSRFTPRPTRSIA